jgi:hypothetical protein
MDKTLASILGASGLSTEIVESLQEAFDKKVAEARAEAELAMREEFARRYEHDKSALVEAMDRMLTTEVGKFADQNAAQFAQFNEARDAFRAAVNESRTHYQKKLREHLSMTKQFAKEQLMKEAMSYRAAKKSLAEAKASARAELTAFKEAAVKTQAARMKKIDEFVVAQVGKELREFSEDHRALVETRVKLVTEGRKRLKETRDAFIKQSATKVEQMVTESLKSEMKQLHEDLERNRQNTFGRRIFEAVAAEYMASYLAEGTEVKKLQSMLEGQTAELSEVKTKLDEAQKGADQIRRKAHLAESRAERSRVMAELLSPLRGEKRVVMEGMLETVKTDNLRTAFKKLLPVVMTESRRPAAQAPAGARKLMENPQTPTRAVTGDRANRTLFESSQAEIESEIDLELAKVVRLAGIQK